MIDFEQAAYAIQIGIGIGGELEHQMHQVDVVLAGDQLFEFVIARRLGHLHLGWGRSRSRDGRGSVGGDG